MNGQLSPVAQALKDKRQELIEKPLSRIYEELAEAAREAYLAELDDRWKHMFDASSSPSASA